MIVPLIPSPRFDTLILDLGGVLIKVPPNVPAKQKIPSLKRLTSTLAWMQYECGEIEEKHCYEILGKQFGFSPSALGEGIAQARMTVEYDQEIVSWIQALRENHPSLKIFAMSNISKPDFDSLFARWGADIWSLFDEVFTSSTAGVRKPDLGFYEHVMKSTGVDPARTIFVDDNVFNTISAGSLGMHAVLFEDPAALARTIKNLLVDVVTRGNAWLKQNAKKMHSFTECGVLLWENYAQLLILEATGNEELVLLKKPDYGKGDFWNFYLETPPFAPEALPDDHDTTSLGMQVLKFDDALANSLLDQMLEWVNEDGIIYMYRDRDRPRFDPIVSVNICTSFYLYQRGHQVQKMLEWVRNILYHRAYSEGTYYFRCPDWFLFYINRLLVVSKAPDLALSFGALLKERVQERVGLPGDSIALAMRVIVCNAMGVYNYQDIEALKGLQMEDGGWEASYLYSFPIIGKKAMNRGLGTALAVQALSGRFPRP